MWTLFSEWERDDEVKSDVNVWEDNWDDDNIADDFSVQLRSVVLSRCHFVI